MAARNTIIRHYLPVVEIKDFDVLIGNKIFDQLPKNQTRNVWKTCLNVKKQWLCNRKFLGFSYHQKYDKLTGIDLLRQKINFAGKL